MNGRKELRTRSVDNQQLDIEVIRAKELTESDRLVWLKLLHDSKNQLNHPLLQAEYTLAVASVRDNVEVARISRGSEIVGFFPFQRRRGNLGSPVGGEASDMHGIVCSEEIQIEAHALLEAAGLISWEFDHLPVTQRPFQPYHDRIDDAYVIDLTNGFGHFIADRKQHSSVISQAQRKRRKLEKDHGKVRFEFQSASQDALQRLLAWKTDDIIRRQQPNTLGQVWIQDLARHLAATQASSFCGLLSTLYAGEELVSAHLGVGNRCIVSSWLPAHNPEFAKYSPGLLLQLELAEASANQGYSLIDLGRGTNMLKRQISTGTRPLAIGSVELLPHRRFLKRIRLAARRALTSTGLDTVARSTYHRLRNWSSHGLSAKSPKPR